MPEPVWPYEPSPEGTPLASEVYENVQVLGHLPSDQFDRLMAQITEWVSPITDDPPDGPLEQGCNYCHNPENLADDSVYTKIVSRRMIQMTQTINSEWQDHVAQTGVNCYTCHRGLNVPANIWFTQDQSMRGMVGYRAGQNEPGHRLGLAARVIRSRPSSCRISPSARSGSALCRRPRDRRSAPRPPSTPTA